MTISLGVPSIDSQNADALTLNVAALTAISGVQIANANSYAALPSLPLAAPSPVTAVGAVSAPAVASELDPLTPRGVTASGAAALTHVITTITTTLNGIQANTVAGLTQLVTSSSFQLLLQVLGSGGSAVASTDAAGQTSSAQLAALLTTADSSQPGVSAAASAADTVAPIPGQAVIEQSSNSVNPAPYFQQLLGELEDTYKTAPVPSPAANTAASAASSTPAQNSELDLFLKWLSVHGASSVVASA